MSNDTQDTNGAEPANERPLPTIKTLAKAIEAQRQHLAQVRAIVHSNADLLHETYRFEVGEADLAYCADVVCDMLGRVIAALEPLTIAPEQDRPPPDPMKLAREIEAPRQDLFRTQAVAEAIANLMQTHQFEEGEANLRIVFSTVVEMMETAISELEPLTLGLPIPSP
jgi:hypothetical protein